MPTFTYLGRSPAGPGLVPVLFGPTGTTVPESSISYIYAHKNWMEKHRPSGFKP